MAESTFTVDSFQRQMHWVARFASLIAASAAMGLIGAWFVWGFIYGIGSSVVTDELYERLRDVIPRYGLQVGLVTGTVACFMPLPRGFFCLLAVHGFAVLAGMIGGTQGWAPGLAGYFGTHLLGFVGIIIATVISQRRTPK
jgi:hypothetical protein